MKHEETARRLREALLKSGLTQQELADKSGISKVSVSQYINGTHIPGNLKAGAMAEVLGCDPMWLMGIDIEKPNKNKEAVISMFDSMSEKQQERLVAYMKLMMSE